MSKLKLITLLIGGCLLLALVALPVRGDGNGVAAAQTIPTRTPTGEAPPDTDTPPPPTDTPQAATTPDPSNTPGSGGGNPTATPTVTRVVATPTRGVTVPAGAFQATAVSCGRPPTLQAKNLINIRSGPGTDYPISGSLVFGEVRHIVGRSDETNWWAIEMPAETFGWVADPVVNISGYTGDIPVLEMPLINGNTPTPGTPWSPTPNTACPTTTATPSATPTPSETPTAAATATETATEVVETIQETATLEVAETVAPTIEGPEATLPPVGENPTAPAGTADEDPEPSNNGWVLYAGLGLVVVGGAAFFFLSRRQ